MPTFLVTAGETQNRGNTPGQNCVDSPATIVMKAGVVDFCSSVCWEGDSAIDKIASTLMSCYVIQSRKTMEWA